MELSTFMYLAAVAIIVVWPAALNYFDATFYRELRKSIGCLSPPAFFFPIVWIPLYGIITVAEIYHVLNATSPLTVLWIATASVFLFNLLLNHRWCNIFFKNRAFWHAFVNIIFVFLSAVATLVLYAFDGHWTSFWWYLAYPIFLIYGIFLNGVWASKCVVTPRRQQQQEQKKK